MFDLLAEDAAGFLNIVPEVAPAPESSYMPAILIVFWAKAGAAKAAARAATSAVRWIVCIGLSPRQGLWRNAANDRNKQARRQGLSLCDAR
jgi:hypothetical protein